MALQNSQTTYGSLAKFFHWLIFLLLLGQVTFGYFLEDIPKDLQPFAYNTHKLIGLTVLVLMVLRLVWALCNPSPRLPTGTFIWERWAEKLVHFSLYAVVMAMPIAGLIGSDAAGRPPHLGDFQLMLPGIVKDKALADAAFGVHNTLAIILIVLFSIHVLAALYHHFIKRDDILRRMMPHCCQR